MAHYYSPVSIVSSCICIAIQWRPRACMSGCLLKSARRVTTGVVSVYMYNMHAVYGASFVTYRFNAAIHIRHREKKDVFI